MEILHKLKSVIDSPIDYHGQELSRKLFYSIIYFGYGFSLLTGVLYNDLKYTLALGILTVLIVFGVCVPSWRMYRKNPFKFEKKKTE